MCLKNSPAVISDNGTMLCLLCEIRIGYFLWLFSGNELPSCPAFFKDLRQVLALRVGDVFPEEDVRDGHSEGDAEDDEGRVDAVGHGVRHLAYHAVHVDEAQQAAVHEHAGNHGDDRRCEHGRDRRLQQPRQHLGIQRDAHGRVM